MKKDLGTVCKKFVCASWYSKIKETELFCCNLSNNHHYIDRKISILWSCLNDLVKFFAMQRYKLHNF